jgi:hypothetical protein
MIFRRLFSIQRPQVPPPTWKEIAASIRALGGADRPIFTLTPEGGHAEGILTVQGHREAYTMTVYLPCRGRFRYCNPHCNGSAEVEIYGYEGLWDYVDKRFICTDLLQVLGVVRFFWEYGELHPAMNWEKV